MDLQSRPQQKCLKIKIFKIKFIFLKKKKDYGHTVEKKEQEKTAQPIENKNDSKAKNE